MQAQWRAEADQRSTPIDARRTLRERLLAQRLWLWLLVVAEQMETEKTGPPNRLKGAGVSSKARYDKRRV